MKGSTNSFVFKAAEQGIVSVSVTAPEGVSVAGRTVTATASGQTTQTRTIPSGATSVAFSLPAGTWTFSVDLPSSSYKTSSKTQTVADGEQYFVTLAIELGLRVYGFYAPVDIAPSIDGVTYPETIFGQANLAYGKTPASGTGANCMNDWAGCELITGIKRQTQSNASPGVFNDVTDKRARCFGHVIIGQLTYEDVFTYVPTWWMKMTNDGTNIYCAFANEQIDETWKDYAGSVGSNHVGHFRVGCFAAYSTSASIGYIYSIGNVTPLTGINLSKYIAYAKARGTGYDIMTWYQWTYLAALATLLYKSTDLQSALGQGYTGGSSVQSETKTTNFSNDYGMEGSSSTKQQMAFFWIQNLWGNMWQLVGGAMTDSSYRLMTCTGYSSTEDSDFDKTSLSVKRSSSLSGYISNVVGTLDAGFFPTLAQSTNSSAAKFHDGGFINSLAVPYVGGFYDSKDLAGPFCVSFTVSSANGGSYFGSRLSYRL